MQVKTLKLSAGQIWDGPPVDDLKGYNDDDEIRGLIRTLASRRVPLADATAAIKAFAEKQPAGNRNAKLTLLFAGFLALVNEDRVTIVNGIERFEKRQKARAEQFQKESGEKAKQSEGEKAKSDKDKAENEKGGVEIKGSTDELGNEAAEDWDARIFSDRQANVNFACEIPALIDERAGAMAREIRGQMKD